MLSLWMTAVVLAMAALRPTFADFAQPVPGLYGLVKQDQLVYIYPNATVEPIGEPLRKGVQAAQLCTLDASAGIWYSIFLDEKIDSISLLGISLQTGGIVSNVSLPFDPAHGIGAGQLLAWELGATSLVAGGLLDRQHPTSHVVGRLEPVNGTWTELVRINTSFMPPLASTQAAALIPGVPLLVFELGDFTTPNIVQLNLATGALSHYKGDDANILSLSYDPVSQKVYGIATVLQNSSYIACLVVLDPQALTVSVVGLLNEFFGMDTGVATLDPVARALVWLGMKRDDPDGPMYLIYTALANATTISAAPLAQADASPVGLQYFGAPSY